MAKTENSRSFLVIIEKHVQAGVRDGGGGGEIGDHYNIEKDSLASKSVSETRSAEKVFRVVTRGVPGVEASNSMNACQFVTFYR